MEVHGEILSPNTYLFIQGDDELNFQSVCFPPSDFSGFSHDLTFAVVSALEERGVRPPTTAIKEIVDNLAHALPCEVCVLVHPEMGFVSFSDTGPGIPDLDLAMQPGYTTANDVLRRSIRGAGMGFFLARREMEERGGNLVIMSRPDLGTYVRLEILPERLLSHRSGISFDNLSMRQIVLMTLLADSGPLNAQQLAKRLGVSVSTAYRDARDLVQKNLVIRDPSGKIFLSTQGRRYLQSLSGL